MNYIKKINQFFLIIIILFFTFYFIFENNFFYNKIISPITKIFIKKNSYSTLYGEYEIDEDILNDALKNPALMRMQNIDQSGPLPYFNLNPFFSRYEHCIGVWSLIRQYGGSLNEQLAGLFHDVSHTAFSHIADNVFKKNNEEYFNHSYQDSIHLWFLENSPVKDLCKKYNIELNSLDPENPEYTMLEADLPDMCADRIEYNLHTAYVFKLYTKTEIQEIVNHLHYDSITYVDDQNNQKTGKKWYFDDIIYAKKFALLPLYFIKSLWNSGYNMVFYKVFSYLIKYALEKKYITQKDFLFGTDQKILNILSSINDPIIISIFDIVQNIFNYFEIIRDNKEYDEILKEKFRGIDPLVKINNNFIAKRLTTLDSDFNYFFHLIKKENEFGYKIKYHNKIHDLKIYV